MKRILSLLIAMTLVLSFCTCCTVSAVDLNGVEEDLGPNLALGKPVSAPFQYRANYSPDKITDGKTGSMWIGYRSEALEPRFDEFDKVVVDLGMVYDLNAIVVRSRRDVNSSGDRSAWVVQVASEPRPYKDAVKVGERMTALAFKEDLVLKFDEPIQGRYIIFYNSLKGIAAVSEIEAYGSVSAGKPVPSYNDIEVADYNAVEMVSKLGIVEGISTSEFGVDHLIRREEAAQVVALAANLPLTQKGTSSFSDVAPDNKFLNYIEACLNAGVISKAENYRPDDFIRTTEFLKMIISAMGYDFVLPRFGEYPNNVLNLAAELELTKNVNVKDSEYISRVNISKVLYNALLLPSSRITEFTEEASLYSAGPNMLKSTYGLELKKGVVTENDITNLIQPISGTTNLVKIDGVEYYDPNGKLNNMVGRSVMYLVNDDKEIFDMWQEKQRQTVSTIYSKDIVFDESSLDEIVVDLGEENGEESYAIDDQPYVLKNGVAYDDYTVDKLDVSSGKVELIDNDGDGSADVIYIWDPEVIVVENLANTLSGRLAITGLNGESIDVSDYKHLSCKNGEKIVDITTILGGMLVYAYVSEDGNNVLLETVKNSVIGTLMNADDERIVVEDKEYGISDYFIRNSERAPKFTLGMKAKFFFDEHDDLIWIDDVEYKKASDVLGVSLVYEKARSLTNAHIMVYNENSEKIALNFADKVKIDGTLYTQDKLNTLVESNPEYLKGKMVLYSTNNQGEISVLDTEEYVALKEPNSKLKRMNVSLSTKGVKTNLGFYSGHNMLLPMVNEFPVFCIPFSGTTPLIQTEYDRYYSISTSTKQIPNGTSVKVDESFTFYCADDLGSPTLGMRKVGVVAGANAQGVVESYSASNAPGLVVDTLSVVNNSSGTQSYKISGYDISTGKKTELITHEELKNVVETCKIRSGDSVDSSWYADYRLLEASKIGEMADGGFVSSILTLKKGDIIRYEVNDDNVLNALERVFDSDIYVGTTNYKAVYAAGDAYSNVRAQFRLTFSELLDVKGDYLLVNSGGSNTDLFKYADMAGGLYVCEDGKLTKCELKEIALYAGAAAQMATFSTSGTYNAIVIYVD